MTILSFSSIKFFSIISLAYFSSIKICRQFNYSSFSTVISNCLSSSCYFLSIDIKYLRPYAISRFKVFSRASLHCFIFNNSLKVITALHLRSSYANPDLSIFESEIYSNSMISFFNL